MINFLAKLNPNFIEIGNFSIKWYAVCILIGVVICYITVVHLFKKAGFKPMFYGITIDTLVTLTALGVIWCMGLM